MHNFLWGSSGFKPQNNNEFLFLLFSRTALTAMPLFSWMKWSQETRVEAHNEPQSLKTSGVVPSRMLIRELLWHVEEHERLARELEWEHRLADSTFGLQWFQYPRLRTLIPASELHQLEFLCSQIPPIHAATILSRCLVASMLCRHINMLSSVASRYYVNTRANSRESREDSKGKGDRASCYESHYVLLSQKQVK